MNYSKSKHYHARVEIEINAFSGLPRFNNQCTSASFPQKITSLDKGILNFAVSLLKSVDVID